MDNSPLKFQVATPCGMDWKEMAGDERIRFCLHCSKNVYNISGFSTEEVRELIRHHEGKFCVRIYQREDGTVVTRDCRAVKPPTQTRMVIGATVAVLTVISGLGFLMGAQPSGSRWSSLQTRAQYRMEEFSWKIKELFGVKRPRPMVMGKIAIPVHSVPGSSGAGTTSAP